MQTAIKRKRDLILFAIAIIALIALLCISPIPQDVSYHDFADQRPCCSINNFGDVVGNLPFAIFGLMGLWHCLFITKITGWPKAMLTTFFFGGFFTCFGSSYYHLNPNNTTLVWDRLSMTIAFCPLFSFILYDYVSERVGKIAFIPLMIVGLWSVYYWHHTEQLGAGDLRPYVWVQFFPILSIPFILWLYTPKLSINKYYWIIIGWYMTAKLLETFDKQFYALTQQVVSGHTLKHVAASFSILYMFLMLKKIHAKNK